MQRRQTEVEALIWRLSDPAMGSPGYSSNLLIQELVMSVSLCKTNLND